MSGSIETIRTESSITISIPLDDMTVEEVERLIALIKAESILSKSALEQEDADEMAREINRNWWGRNQGRIDKMIAENE
jgi:hypothetical protein